MGRKTFSIAVVSVFIIMAFIIPKKEHTSTLEQPISYDSTELKKHTIYICEGHFFEWCKEPSICQHCNENLVETNLWEYYKKLECEDCKKFFEENYRQFSNRNNAQ